MTTTLNITTCIADIQVRVSGQIITIGSMFHPLLSKKERQVRQMDEKFMMGQEVFDHWQIVRLLRTDSMGNLYQLLYHDHGRDYRAMLKVVSIPRNLRDLILIQDRVGNYQEYFDSVLSFMLEEVDILSQLSGNPYVVHYYDHKVEPHPSGLGYDILLRMEHLTGLVEHSKGRTFTRSDVLQLGIDLCKALEECHEKEILHRDIRPEHIYVTTSGGYKLGDFSVPCVDGKDLLVNNQTTPWEYMAPELYRDEDYDHRVDIYSLGMLLYSMSNQGQLPFYPENPTSAHKVVAKDRRMAGEIVPITPILKRNKLGKILQKACDPNPDLRYRTVREFRRELEASLQKKDDVVIVFPQEKVRRTNGVRPNLLASWFG